MIQLYCLIYFLPKRMKSNQMRENNWFTATPSTVLVQCTVHNHRFMYICTYIYPYTRTYEFPFIFKKLLMTINNDKYVHTYIHTYVYMKVHFCFQYNKCRDTIYTHINTYIYNIHTYIHIYIYIYRQISPL